MCSKPKIEKPTPPPPPPPPPVKTAKKVVDSNLKAKRESNKKSGTSKLTIRRPSVSMNSGGTGASVNY